MKATKTRTTLVQQMCRLWSHRTENSLGENCYNILCNRWHSTYGYLLVTYRRFYGQFVSIFVLESMLLFMHKETKTSASSSPQKGEKCTGPISKSIEVGETILTWHILQNMSEAIVTKTQISNYIFTCSARMKRSMRRSGRQSQRSADSAMSDSVISAMSDPGQVLNPSMASISPIP